MTPTKREVRWSVPGFAPSQVPKHEKVLHSIFSPSRHKQPSSRLGDPADKLDQSPKTPKSSEKPVSYTAGSEHFQTPHEVEIASPWRTALDEESDAFFSPQQEPLSRQQQRPASPLRSIPTTSRNSSPMSAISGMTEVSVAADQINRSLIFEDPNNTSFKTLTSIDMLNFDFIGSCESVSDLEKVILVLEGKQNCPELLQTAKTRLQSIQANAIKPLVDAPEEGSPGMAFDNCTADISRITAVNNTMDLESLNESKSTLNFSMSPSSVLHGLDLVDTQKDEDTFASGSDRYFFPLTTERLGPIAEGSIFSTTPRTVSDRKAPRPAPPPPPRRPPPPPPRSNRSLPEEVKNLPAKAMEHEASRMEEQQIFVQKLKELEGAKKEAEQTVQNLKTKMTSADGKTKDLMDSMRKIQQEQNETRQNLEKERILREQKHDCARQIEERLRRKVGELTKEMAKAEEQSRLKVVAERGLRIKSEKELTGENRRNKELNGVLHETQKHLESLKRSHMQFRLGLLQAMGTDDSRMEIMKQATQHDFIANMTNKITSMKAANEAMSKAFNESEKERQEAVEARQRAEKCVFEFYKNQRNYKEENLELTKKIHELTDEVTSSRAYIDKLLKTTQDLEQSDWEKMEQQYRTVIQNLRHQVRKQGTAVSIDLYKVAIDDSKKKALELKEHEKEIADLKSKVTKLEKDVKAKPTRQAPAAVSKTPRGTKSPRYELESPGDFLERYEFGSPTDFLEQGLFVNAASKSMTLSPPQTVPKDLGGKPEQQTEIPQTVPAGVNGSEHERASTQARMSRKRSSQGPAVKERPSQSVNMMEERPRKENNSDSSNVQRVTQHSLTEATACKNFVVDSKDTFEATGNFALPTTQQPRGERRSASAPRGLQAASLDTTKKDIFGKHIYLTQYVVPEIGNVNDAALKQEYRRAVRSVSVPRNVQESTLQSRSIVNDKPSVRRQAAVRSPQPSLLSVDKSRGATADRHRTEQNFLKQPIPLSKKVEKPFSVPSDSKPKTRNYRKENREAMEYLEKYKADHRAQHSRPSPKMSSPVDGVMKRYDNGTSQRLRTKGAQEKREVCHIPSEITTTRQKVRVQKKSDQDARQDPAGVKSRRGIDPPAASIDLDTERRTNESDDVRRMKDTSATRKKKLYSAVSQVALVERAFPKKAPEPTRKDTGTSGKSRALQVLFNSENIAPQQLVDGESLNPSKSAPRITIRISKIKAAGGRKALANKLKQIRSPPMRRTASAIQ